MDAASSKFPVWFIAFVFLSLHVYMAEGRNESNPCVDRTYDHGGRRCCLCNAGQYLKEHCKTDLQYGICENCPPKMYSSQPNDLDSCEPCTSCSQPNANLEEKEPCTSGSDAKCRCKKDHYCSSGTETCRLCSPCRECPEGIKVACSASNNTVCKEKIEGVNNIGVIIGSVVVLLVIIALGYCIWKRYCKRNPKPHQMAKADDVEFQRLPAPVVDLQPYLVDIAQVIGWRDMQDVAMRSNIQNTVIESCKLDHPNDSQEQTLKLLNIWAEKQGREASKDLIEILEDRGKRGKAEKVKDILSRS